VENLPNRRESIEGETFDGMSLRLVHTIARKLYRCPGCHGSVEIGSAHTLVHYLSAEPPFYQHWHEGCAATELVRELKTSKVVRAT
jgi:hypothetical protein